MLDFVAHLPFLHTVNKLLGGILGFLEFYLITFVVVYVATVVPIDGVQTALQQSTVAKWMVYHTPYLSDWLQSLWTNFNF